MWRLFSVHEHSVEILLMLTTGFTKAFCMAPCQVVTVCCLCCLFQLHVVSFWATHWYEWQTSPLPILFICGHYFETKKTPLYDFCICIMHNLFIIIINIKRTIILLKNWILLFFSLINYQLQVCSKSNFLNQELQTCNLLGYLMCHHAHSQHIKYGSVNDLTWLYRPVANIMKSLVWKKWHLFVEVI